jgi:hypothetical protein
MEVLLEAEMNALLEGIHVGSSIATWSGKIPILISNMSDQPIKLPRSKLVGEVGSISRSDQRYVKQNMEEVFKEHQTHPPFVTRHDVDLKAIPYKQRQEYLNLLNQFVDVLSVDPNKVGRCRVVPQRIMLKDKNKVSCTSPYRVPHHLKEVVINMSTNYWQQEL